MEKIGRISIVIIAIFLLPSCRTPRSIIKAVYGIDINMWYYTVETFDNQWCLNGDGDCYISLDISGNTDFHIQYLLDKGFKPLPVIGFDNHTDILSYYVHTENKGYYLIDYKDYGNYSLIVVDINEKKMIIYYSIS